MTAAMSIDVDRWRQSIVSPLAYNNNDDDDDDDDVGDVPAGPLQLIDRWRQSIVSPLSYNNNDDDDDDDDNI